MKDNPSKKEIDLDIEEYMLENDIGNLRLVSKLAEEVERLIEHVETIAERVEVIRVDCMVAFGTIAEFAKRQDVPADEYLSICNTALTKITALEAVGGDAEKAAELLDDIYLPMSDKEIH